MGIQAAELLERAYRVRAYPTRQQRRVLAQLCGAKRFVWNWALAHKRNAYRERKESISTNQISREFTQLKAQPAFAWLSALPREPITQVLRDLNQAYSNFFAKRARYPRFKKKEFAGSFRVTLDQRREQVDRTGGRVQIDGVGKVKFKLTEDLQGRLRSATVSRDSAGRYFISFTADRVPAPAAAAATIGAVGIDQGIKTLLVTSENERTPVSRALDVRERRLKRYQRSQVRRMRTAKIAAGFDPGALLPKGAILKKSKRFERNRIRIARLYAQVRDARQDLLHKATTALVAQHALIGMESLSVKGMQRGLPRVRRRVGNACLGEVRRQLKYKAAWAGRRLILVDRFFPSSQLCSTCGWQHKELSLSDRRWQCAECGAEHDRDHNAAKNILSETLRIAAAEDGYREEPGKSRAGSVVGALERTALDPALDTMNRELICTVREADEPTSIPTGSGKGGGSMRLRSWFLFQCVLGGMENDRLARA